MTTLQKIAYSTSVFAAGFAVARFAIPARVETQVETRVVERLITQEVKKADQVITEIVRKRPDGTITTKKVTQDRSVTSSVSSSDTEVASLEQTVSENTREEWALGAVYAVRSPGIFYGVALERRILGPVWLGAFGLTDGTLGLRIGISF